MTNKLMALTLVALFAWGTLFLFGCGRDSSDFHGYGHQQQNHHGNMLNNGHPMMDDDAPMTNAEGHMSENDDHMMNESGHMSDYDSEHVMDLQFTGMMRDGVRVIPIIARRFDFEPSQIVVKKGDRVRLVVTSEDVEHGLAIEGYNLNMDIPANETNTMEFTADRAGTFRFHCSVYCGPGHNEMHGTLIVLPGEE